MMKFKLLIMVMLAGDALSFLHKVCTISVNNLSVDSIFLSKNDSNEVWKLGSLYWNSSIDTENEEFFRQLISFHTAHGSIKCLPAEDREMSTHKLIRSSKEIHRRDFHAFVTLIGQLLYNANNPPKLSEMILGSENSVQSLSYTVKTFVDSMNSLTCDQRLPVENLLNHQLFSGCVFVQIRQFFNIFNTFTDVEKDKFFETFIDSLRLLPDPLLVVNIFTMIVSSRVIMSNNFIYNDVMPYFLIPCKENYEQSIVGEADSQHDSEDDNQTNFMLTGGRTITLNPLIPISIYRDHIIPLIANLYCVHDFKIRMLLLQYLPHYGSLISKNCLRKIILPQILLGIKDSSDELVSLTFRALAVLVDLFGVVNVLGGSKRPKYFVTGVTRHNRLSSQASNADSNERDYSNVSLKSNASTSSFPMAAHFISERSSPDGDEIDRPSQLSQSDSKVGHFEKNWSDGEDIWQDWDDKPEKNIPEKAVQNGTTSNGKPTNVRRKSINQTFDIKELDFKDIEGREEIDNLFMDLAPVLDFSKKPLRLEPKRNGTVEKESPTTVDMHLFAPKHHEGDIDDSAWNDSLEWNDVDDEDNLDEKLDQLQVSQ